MLEAAAEAAYQRNQRNKSPAKESSNLVKTYKTSDITGSVRWKHRLRGDQTGKHGLGKNVSRKLGVSRELGLDA